MDPTIWGRTIVDHLERQGLLGSLLPRGASGAGDRYQPNRVFVNYAWSGQASAATRINFKVHAPEDREQVNIAERGWTVLSSAALDSWGDQWEDIDIEIPGGAPQNRREEFHAVGRFRILVEVADEPISAGAYNRRITLENLRETGGMLHSIRIIQSSIPTLQPYRPYGVGEDIYYRAGGLVGSLNRDRNELVFAPYALLPEPIRRPVVGPSLDQAIQQGILLPSIVDLLREQGIDRLFQFQADSIADIRRSLAKGNEEGAILLTGGTAAGKTEAFLVPLLETLVEDHAYLGVRGVFVYPTKALEADQARRFFEYLARFNSRRRYPISIGLLDGDTPYNFDELMRREQNGEIRSPFSECPQCANQLMFTVNHDGQQLTVPTCSGCGATFPWLRVDRNAIQERWPHLLLTVPDMLHRLISNDFAWRNQAMLGRDVHYCNHCGKYSATTTRTVSGKREACSCGEAFSPAVSLCPSLIVFDEAHLLKGLFGSQVGMLIARIKQISRFYKHNPLFVGASATIAHPDDFGLQLFGAPVHTITGQEEFRFDEEPTRYHLFLMPVEVTVLNAVGHILTGCFIADQQAGEMNRVLIFSDSKRTVYQLEASLPEFYATLPPSILPNGSASASTRSHTGDHGPEERRIVETAFDHGTLRVLLATQTLEVGVDFQNLQLELQTGATYSYNDYIQRVGRAGRRGVQALVVCILRPQVPLDYYYFEHCRELVQFSPDTLDEIPLRTDNPFLVERHVPAAIQDYLIGVQPGARLVWFPVDAARVLMDGHDEVRTYLEQIFVRTFSWDADLIRNAIDQGIERVLAALGTQGSQRNTADRLVELIELSIRATDVGVPIESEDFYDHRAISRSGVLAGEELEEPEADEEVGQE